MDESGIPKKGNKSVGVARQYYGVPRLNWDWK
ncbi:MAG: hypothetical protein ACE5KT_09980 [Methanosarcinales archaeon]